MADRVRPMFWLETFVVLTGSWTIACNLVVAAGGSFAQLRWLGPVVLVTTVRVMWLRREPPASEDVPSEPRDEILQWPLKILLAVAAVGVYALFGHYALFWGLGLALLVIAGWDAPAGNTMVLPVRRRELGAVAFLAVAMGGVTLVAHRFDIDDAFYLNLVVDALAHPGRALLAEDWMHGETGWPLLGPFYRVTSHELGVATWAWWSRLSPLPWYYLILPALMAATVVVVHWAILRRVAPRPLVGLAVTLLALVAWGEPHLSFGNFAFVRLFQGKALLVSVGVPTVLLCALRWIHRRDRWSWCLLALAQIATMGFSSTGLVIAPLVAGLVLVGWWRPDRLRTWTVAVGASASTWVVLAAILVSRASFSDLLQEEVIATRDALAAPLGEPPAQGLALVALLALGAMLSRRAGSRALLGFLVAAFALLFNPWSGAWLSGTLSVLSTRIFWAVPFGLILGALAGHLSGRGRVGWGLTLALAVGIAVVPGQGTLAEGNRVALGWPHAKVAPEREVAGEAIHLTPDGGLILAPFAVSCWIPTHPRRVRTLGVRPQYLTELVQRELGGQEAFDRFVLQEFLEGRDHHPEGVLYSLDAIEHRRIDTVVVSIACPTTASLESGLRKLEYTPHAAAAGHRIWTR